MIAAAPVGLKGASSPDVLVTHAFYMALDAKQTAKRRPYPPLATLQVAAGLRQAGHTLAFFDAMLAPSEAVFAAALDFARPRVVVLVEDNFNFLSKMCLGRMREAALRMVADARAVGAHVLVGGSDATDDPEVYLAAGATAVMPGEPDATAVEAVAALVHAGDLASVPGLVLPPGQSGQGFVSGPPGGSSALNPTATRPPERAPDMFPWPARDLVDLEAYDRVWQDAHGHTSLNMVSTRGCPFHCNWCAKPIWGQRYAMRTPVDVAAEMAAVKLAYGPNHIWFADDIFGLRPDWTAAFGRAVAALDAQIPFQIQSRVDLMTPAAVAGLAQAGCAEVWLGVESGSQRILDAMEKGVDVRAVAPAVERLRAHGIQVGFFLQFGYPGEEWSDIEATAALVRTLLPDAVGVSVSYPLPGTRFHAAVRAQLGPKRHWDDSRDLAMMFQGSYTTAFYRRLHALVHREHDARLARARAADPASVRRADDEVADAMLEWSVLAAERESYASPTPTVLSQAEPRPAPDLSRAAN